MQGYTQFFGTKAQPNRSVRSAMQVAALANPAFLVEIEATAVRPWGRSAPVWPAAKAPSSGSAAAVCLTLVKATGLTSPG